MHTPEDQAILVRELIGTGEAMGQAMSPTAAVMIIEDLADVPVNRVREALRAVRRNYKSRLTYAVIREHLHKIDGRPEPNEAWALALQSQDERESVVWTGEVATALEAARPILNAGDKVAARMAFLNAYERLVLAARDAGVPPHWSLSMGWEPEGRALALEQAVRLERIPLEQAKQLGYGGHLQLSAPSSDGQAIAGLITGKAEERVSPDVAAHIRKIRQILVGGEKQRQAEREAENKRKRDELDEKKRIAAEKVAQHLGKEQLSK